MAAKKPPTFHFLPKTRAKRLKKSWVEDHKIRRKWRAQKRREGLLNHVEDTSSHRQDEVDTDSPSNTSPDRPDKSPSPAPPQNKQSLRDLRRIAYASKPRHTQNADSSHHGRRTTVGHDTGQPNMKLRMNVLLEKIKRDLS